MYVHKQFQSGHTAAKVAVFVVVAMRANVTFT